MMAEVIRLPVRSREPRWHLYAADHSEACLHLGDVTVHVPSACTIEGAQQLLRDAPLLADLVDRIDPAAVEEAEALSGAAPVAAEQLLLAELLDRAETAAERAAVMRLLG